MASPISNSALANVSEGIKKNMFKDPALNDALNAEVTDPNLKVSYNGRQWAVGTEVFDITAHKMNGFKSFCKRVIHFFKSWSPKYRDRFKVAVQHMAEAQLTTAVNASRLMMANEQFKAIAPQLKKDMAALKQLEEEIKVLEQPLKDAQFEANVKTKLALLEKKAALQQSHDGAATSSAKDGFQIDLENVDKMLKNINAKLEAGSAKQDAVLAEKKPLIDQKKEQAAEIRNKLKARGHNLQTEMFTDEADLKAHLERAMTAVENAPSNLRKFIKSEQLAKRDSLKMDDEPKKESGMAPKPIVPSVADEVSKEKAPEKLPEKVEVEAEQEAKAPVEVENAAPVAENIPLSEASNQFLDALGAQTNQETKALWWGFLQHFANVNKEDLVAKCEVKGNMINVQFKEKLMMWMLPKDEKTHEEDPPGGVVLVLGGNTKRELQIEVKKDGLIKFKEGFNLITKTPSYAAWIPGVKAWACATIYDQKVNSSYSTVTAGKGSFSKTKNTPTYVTQEAWSKNGYVITDAEGETLTDSNAKAADVAPKGFAAEVAFLMLDRNTDPRKKYPPVNPTV